MIYIDPPYNTGSDFVYEDDFADPMARYKEVTQQTTKSNAETMGRYHTNWLNMMYPRLRLAANLLADDGAIFISIDDKEITNMKKLCDEIFGEENCLGTILWKKKTNGNNMGFIPPVHDYVVAYARSIENIKDLGYDITEEYINKTYSNPDNDPRGPWTTMDLSANHKGPHFSIINPKTGDVFDPPEGRYWVFNEEEVKRRIADGRIIFGKTGTTRPVQKVFAAERIKGKIRAESWWDKHGMNEDATVEIRELFGQGKLFTHPKPTKLIYNLVKIATNKDDIVMDFFSGSATTAHSVMQLNAEDGGTRKVICVQLPEICDENSEAFKAGFKNICELGKERIRRAGKKILEEATKETVDAAQYGESYDVDAVTNKYKNLDIGFKVFKLDTSNLKTWDGTPIYDKQIDLFYERLNAMIDTVKDDRTDMDVVYEVMLKMGIPLDVEVQYMEINDKIAYIVGDFILMICLADKITAEDIEAMAQYAPAKIICAEAGFADDSALSNAHYILKDRAIELKLV